MLNALADDESEASQIAAFAGDNSDGNRRFIEFDSLLYAIIPAIHELKVLYTAVTRARFGCLFLEI